MRPLAIIALALTVLSPGWDAQAAGSTDPDRSALLIELRNGKFDDLDSQLLQLETAFENDRHQEIPVQAAFASFASSDPTLEEPLQRWVARQPKSFAARLARGIYYNHLADLSRGAEAPSATPPQRLAEMARYQLLAQDDFQAAIDLRPLAIAAHAGIVAILVDRRDEAALQQHAAAAASSLGPTFAVCDAYMARFDYRHGGDRAGLEHFDFRAAIRRALRRDRWAIFPGDGGRRSGRGRRSHGGDRPLHARRLSGRQPAAAPCPRPDLLPRLLVPAAPLPSSIVSSPSTRRIPSPCSGAAWQNGAPKILRLL